MKVHIVSLLLLAVVSYCAAAFIPFGKAPSCMLDDSCGNHDWLKQNPAYKDDMIELVFAVRQKNLDYIKDFVAEVSDPENPKYGQYLTFEQLGAIVSDAEAESQILNWLKINGVNSNYIKTIPNKEFIRVRLSVETAEKMLNTVFYSFLSVRARTTIIRTTEYSIPEEIAPFIRFVGYTVQFPAVMRPGRIQSIESTLEFGTTDPALIKSYYNISKDYTTNPRTSQSLFEALGQNFSPDDLTTFQKKYNLDIYAVSTVVGTNRPSICSTLANQCTEANLDVQYIMAIAQKANTTYWSMPVSSADIFLDWIEQVAADSNPPFVHSISYGSIENELDPSPVRAFDDEASKLAARGITIIISSGDDGVANFQARSDKSKCGFNPSFPATATYITSVGATQGPEAGGIEIACSSSTSGLITTGGGFSTVFSRPSYQSAAVQNYLKNGPNMPPTSLFASTGRGYPDVGLMGHNYAIVVGGRTYQVSGTSASAPVFAGMISLINDLRFNQGKSPLGFLNTALYKAPSGIYHDVTYGENNCCAGNKGTQVCCQYGFTATTGWDPLTGFGSVNYGLLADYLLSA